MKKSILIIVTERNSANGICTKAVAEAFVQNGWNVSCIINKEVSDKIDLFCLNGVDYHVVRPRLVYSLLNGKNSSLWKILKIFAVILNKVELFLALPTWPLISKPYSKRIYSKASQLHKENGFSIIVPVYTQIDTIIAAQMMYRNYGVNYIPYFLDSLAGGYGPRFFPEKWVQKRGLKWERKLLLSAKHIVMMLSSRNFYEERKKNLPYYDKITFLDLPLYMPKKRQNAERNIRDTNKCIKTIVYVGSIPVHIRNPKFFLDVFSSLKKSDLRLLIIGACSDESLISKYVNKDVRIQRIPPVSHKEALEYINQADILLNLGNNMSTMTPSKIFEYISTGKPIISTAPIRNEPCIPYLKKYKNACVIFESDGIEMSKSIIEDFLNTDLSIDANVLDDEFCLNKPDTFVRIVSNCII